MTCVVEGDELLCLFREDERREGKPIEDTFVHTRGGRECLELVMLFDRLFVFFERFFDRGREALEGTFEDEVMCACLHTFDGGFFVKRACYEDEDGSWLYLLGISKSFET